MLCLDLDGFKGVNDTLRHPVGDALLRIVGALLLDLSPDAFVTRLGDDEFAVILQGRFDPDRPRVLAQRIIDRMREPMRADGHQIATATSIGIAIGPADGDDADLLHKNADRRMGATRGVPRGDALARAYLRRGQRIAVPVP